MMAKNELAKAANVAKNTANRIEHNPTEAGPLTPRKLPAGGERSRLRESG